jgi:ribosomal protein S18 acetylase RimI-like enzyme
MNVLPVPIIPTRSNYERLLALWDAAGLSYRPDGRDSQTALKRQVEQGWLTILGVESGNNLIAAVLITHDGRKGWINRLAVLPDFRRQGIARQLIEASEERLRNIGIEVYAALIEPGNEASLALFSDAGYVDYEDIHYMTKREREDV